MSDVETIPIEPITLETEIPEEDASREIEKAVSARHSIARKYVLRLRRRNPNATPADVVRMLERHYATSITTAGAVITASGIAASVAISLIPLGGAAGELGKQATKKAAAEAAKRTAAQTAKVVGKKVALGAAKSGAERVAALLPAGDQQLQFEITAIFALALADIHGMKLDQAQSHALIYGLTNERVGQKQLAQMASDVAADAAGEDVAAVQRFADNRGDWTHWATTLSEQLPAGAAQSFVATIQTGEFNSVREKLSGKQQAAVEYGVAAVVGGVTRFVFGRDVVSSTRIAFPEPPEVFPAYLSVPAKEVSDEELAADVDSNRALSALENAASLTGGWIAGTAGAVGAGVATAADKSTRVLRRVDLDGDGIPDEAQALTAVKGLGSKIGGAAGAAGEGVRGLFKKKAHE